MKSLKTVVYNSYLFSHPLYLLQSLGSRSNEFDSKSMQASNDFPTRVFKLYEKSKRLRIKIAYCMIDMTSSPQRADTNFQLVNVNDAH